MFTGIITAKGRVVDIQEGSVRRVRIACPYDPDSFELGCSVAHDGVCLTIVQVKPTGEGALYDVEISPETLQKTNLGDWVVGTQINLERALCIGDELGGHLVQGHVDGVGELIAIEDRDGWLHLTVKASQSLSPFIAQKGSIALNGVSLTVNDVEETTFELMIIPHTAEVTTIGVLQPGAHVNLEIDVMARYAARLMQTRTQPPMETKTAS